MDSTSPENIHIPPVFILLITEHNSVDENLTRNVSEKTEKIVKENLRLYINHEFFVLVQKEHPPSVHTVPNV